MVYEQLLAALLFISICTFYQCMRRRLLQWMMKKEVLAMSQTSVWLTNYTANVGSSSTSLTGCRLVAKGISLGTCGLIVHALCDRHLIPWLVVKITMMMKVLKALQRNTRSVTVFSILKVFTSTCMCMYMYVCM